MADMLTYIAASGMDAAMKEINNKANDLANVNTGAYKSVSTKTQDSFYIIESKAGDASQEGEKPVSLYQGTGVRAVSAYRDFSLGARKQTGLNLDFYIQGSGYVAVTLPNTDTAYYRATSLQRNSSGVLVTTEGYPLVDNIVIPDTVSTQDILISDQGVVSYKNATSGAAVVLGQITLNNFINEQGLTPLSNGYYLETAASGSAVSGNPGDVSFGTLDQGALELSNVEISTVFADFMTAQRAYELNAKVLRSADEMAKELQK
ncbi:MAG: flagellar hook-basal body complex protein [Rickettsiaceae bacterium]|nr:flagellar hook-basal body complex protein [Rickettsiaceae bacterium]